MPLAAGPYFEVPVSATYKAPFYALRFDQDGRTTGPQTQRHLLDALPGQFTDIFVFSHGWNNDWSTALKRYKDFFEIYHKVRLEHGGDLGRDYRPLLVGVFWPSTALVMPGERGPEFAGAGDDGEQDQADLALADDLATSVAETDLARFYELLDSDGLDEPEARELARILEGVFEAGDPELAGDEQRGADDLLASWRMYETATSGTPKPRSATGFGAVGAAGGGGPQAAGLWDKLDPRKFVRMLTVYQMKDRAGLIGTNGVGPLLREVLQRTPPTTRIHLVGHSYGARVLLNAVARPTGAALPRAVDSMLLLQPAINHLCFADGVGDHPLGGYRKALELVREPILSTFSNHDVALHDTFHLAMRRGKDVGEIGIAADEPPSKYAALGGYGPRGLPEWREVNIKAPGEPYDLHAGAPEVWAVNGAAKIKGHGDVVSEATAWALLCLVKD